MAVFTRTPVGRAPASPFLILSVMLHAVALLAGPVSATTPLVWFEVPEHVELGLFDQEPGAAAAPRPAMQSPPAAAPPAPAVHRVATPAVADRGPAIEPAEPDRVPDAGQAEDAAEAPPSVAAAQSQDALSGVEQADGEAAGGVGEALGFGRGGFGSGSGGPLGAVIGLHANLERIRRTSLILETSALLGIIPEWQKLLQGSELDELHDFDRVFVATPSLRRSQIVVSARLRGGEDALVRAVTNLARERGRDATPRVEAGIKLWPWHDRGPTERVAGLFGSDQVVIARPEDVGRVLGVSAALAARHASVPGMEKAVGPAALLAMYEDEAVALSVEGVAQFLEGDTTHAPVGLRISLRELDEFHAKLRAHGFYRTEAGAAAAFARAETLRRAFAEHPRAAYLGLRSVIDDATLRQEGSSVVVEAKLTLHQTRYLLAMVRKVLVVRE